ncbi:Indigoidine synthase A like protein-domain-containing protein [Tirmania nivea]|nr:Indigoidine synthase A like protein-domain-containing protein [Tirmania nivea]
MVLMRNLARLSRSGTSGLQHSVQRRALTVASSPLTKFFKVSEEVRAALNARKPVVALESAIYTHGFPYPGNVALAQDIEGQIRKYGAVPATICVLDGVCRVGLDSKELVQIAETSGKKNTSKVSRRDIPYLTGMKLAGKNFNGGTTIAATMILAEMAGIKVFATGGLGGVHRGAESTMDISADLTELGRTNVAVISSGSKAFLDLEKTLEYLETQGVPVSTFGKHGERVEFPAFYSRGSGLLSPNVVETAKEAAVIIHASHTLGLTSGQLFCNPIPKEFEIPTSEITAIIAESVEKARQEGVIGKDNTPYILARIKEKSGGSSISANKALVMDNARMGAQIAVELAMLETVDSPAESKAGYFMHSDPTASLPSPKSHQLSSCLSSSFPPSSSTSFCIEEADKDKADLLIIGSIAVDYTCAYFPSRSSPKPSLATSNPSAITETIGGVGHNVFTAACMYLNGPHTSASFTSTISPPGPKVRLITALSSDLTGQSLLSALKSRGVDTSGILVRDPAAGVSTARYIALNDAKGGLFTAAADMRIVEEMGAEYLRKEIERAKPKWVCIDGNLSPQAIAEVVKVSHVIGAKVAFEPTSAHKSMRLFDSSGLGVFPNNGVHLAAPNEYELKAMWEHAKNVGFLEEMEWFKVVDSVNVDSMFRNSIEFLCQTHKLPGLLEQGLIQQAISLLPYIPTLFVKLGAKGVLSLHLLPPNSPQYPPSPTTITTIGRPSTVTRGVCARYFPPAEKVPQSEVVSVNGVGDTFLGVLLARMVELELAGKQPSLAEQGVLGDVIGLGQKGAVETLRSAEAVGNGVGRLRVRW